MTRLFKQNRNLGRIAMAVYLLLFLVWAVPHHSFEHTPKVLHDTAVLADRAIALSAHNSDLCQLCQTHGQIDLLPIERWQAVVDLPLRTLIVHSEISYSSFILSNTSPRAPPFNA